MSIGRKSSVKSVFWLTIGYVRRILETFSDLDVRLNGGLLARHGFGMTTGLIVLCRDCQTSLQKNTTPESAVSRLYSAEDVLNEEQ